VTIDVAVADLVSPKNGARRAVYSAGVTKRSHALIGATGDPIRYPGVICSREGQEIFVGSHAPVMLTSELQ
jgi:hypothetical protein